MSARRAAKPDPAVPSGHDLPDAHLPSVYDLGVAYAAALRESLDANETSSRRTPEEHTCANWTNSTFTPRADALRELITTLPAQTLADVVVQLGILAVHLANEASDTSDDERRCTALGNAIERVAYSGLAVLVRETGVDLDVLGFPEMPRLHAARFAGMGGVA